MRSRGPAAVLLALLLGLLAGCGAGGSDVEQVVGQGYQAGDGTLTTWASQERGAPVELAGATFEDDDLDLADLRGDVVVLNFWYAACPPCRAEAPDLASFATDYADQGVHMLGVNSVDDAATATAFQETFEVPYPSFADREARAVAALQGAVPLQAMPTTVVLDQQGRVAARVVGLVEGSTLRGLVDDVLAEQA